MIEGGYMHELSQISTFNFDADYWDFDFMDSLCLGDNYYLGYSDFNVMKTYVITFNKEMLEKYSDTLDESVYESVVNYRWTIDKMISLAKLVYIDATGDGKTSDDSKHQQLMACKALVAYGIIKIKFHGMPKKRYFKFDAETFEKLYRELESLSGIPDDFDDVVIRPFRMSF